MTVELYFAIACVWFGVDAARLIYRDQLHKRMLDENEHLPLGIDIRTKNVFGAELCVTNSSITALLWPAALIAGTSYVAGRYVCQKFDGFFRSLADAHVEKLKDQHRLMLQQEESMWEVELALVEQPSAEDVLDGRE